MKNRNELRPVEEYDGNSRRPVIRQLGGADATASQAFWTSQKAVTVGGVPEQLLDKALNPGVIAVVKAKLDNTSDIHVGFNITSSLWTGSQSMTLINGQSEEFAVDNFNRLFINSSASGDGVELYTKVK
jgi:hypothetical protein